MFFVPFDNAKVQPFLVLCKSLTVFSLYIIWSLNNKNKRYFSLNCVEAYSYPQLTWKRLELLLNRLIDYIRQAPNTIRIVAAKIITPIQPNDRYIPYPNIDVKPKAPTINSIAPILSSLSIFFGKKLKKQLSLNFLAKSYPITPRTENPL